VIDSALIELSDRYVAALVAHNPAAVPLAANLVTAENLNVIDTPALSAMANL